MSKSLKCEVLIVGGGVSGISAAAEFVKQGRSVVLIERNIVGGGSAGRSAGFLTPDSELELHQLVRRYGPEAAREIWDAPLRGIRRLVDGIKMFDIQCGLVAQNSLFLGLGKSGKEAVVERALASPISRPTTSRASRQLSARKDSAPTFATAEPTALTRCFACKDLRTC